MRCIKPAPYLTIYFTPRRPALPRESTSVPASELRAAEADIQRGLYREAAVRLRDRCESDARLVVPAAECLLLTGKPAEARALLERQLQPDGNWPLACAFVQQDDLRAALKALASLDRFGGLVDERRVAAALLAADVPEAWLPERLHELTLHPPADLAAARAAGNRRYVESIVRDVERWQDPAVIGRIVDRAEARCSDLPEREAFAVMMPVYEASVHATSDAGLAARAAEYVLGRSTLLGADDADYSRTLLFATVGGRTHQLRARLGELLEAPSGLPVRHARLLAAAKLGVVLDDADEVEANASRAMDAAQPDAGQSGAAQPGAARERARSLLRAGRWLTQDDSTGFSPWALRPLHRHLPLAVAERLEDRDWRFLAELAERAGGSDEGRRAAQGASLQLEHARSIASRPHDQRDLQVSLGQWAWHVAVAMLECRWQPATEPAAFAETARSLLGPESTDEVMATLARALGYAYASSPDVEAVRDDLDSVIDPMELERKPASALIDRVLADWETWRGEGRGGEPDQIDRVAASLRPVWTARMARHGPWPEALADLDVPPGLRDLIERCFADRIALLPYAAPFRGRRWFDSDETYRLYRDGRAAKDPMESYRAFESAWRREPNNPYAIQGLIHGLRRRALDHPGRVHVLERECQILNQRVDCEVEAALAFCTLASLTELKGQDWRSNLQRAAAALRRRANRHPWTRARNVEIALHFELDDLAAAADAAWAEACLWLPGSSQSNSYALLAATLWDRSTPRVQMADERVREAIDRSRAIPLTNCEAVRHAVEIGRLEALDDIDLDGESLRELRRACRGDEDELLRYLKWRGVAEVHRETESPADADPMRLAVLRLAVAELLTHHPADELARSRASLAHPSVRRFVAALRDCRCADQAASDRYATALNEALGTLFDIKQTAPSPQPEPYGGLLARSRFAVDFVRRSAADFATSESARWTWLVARHLATGLDRPTVRDYFREKRMRPAPSRIGRQVGNWWAELRRGIPGSQDFFHHWQSYQYTGDHAPEDWLIYHMVADIPAREAIQKLLDTLERYSGYLVHIEHEYRRTRKPPGAGMRDLGLQAPLTSTTGVLRKALAPGVSSEDLGAIAPALKSLGASLRTLDVARLQGAHGVQLQHDLPEGCYLIPRSPELLTHWRTNVRKTVDAKDSLLRVIFELKDDANRDVLCMLCLDERSEPADETITLHGLAPFADVVEAFGGQLHLWIARPGQGSRCRLEEHRDCAAGDYLLRIERRLRDLSENQWSSSQEALQHWLGVLAGALRGQQSAALAFVIVPRLHEAEA